MASPQLEDGHTRLANEILDAICYYNFNGSQFRIIMKIWRLTFGYGRKDHEFAITFLQSATGLSDRTIKKEVATLVKEKVLLVVKPETSTTPRRLAFNKDYEQWTTPKSGDFMVEEMDLFNEVGGKDASPQKEGRGEELFPSEGKNCSPLVITKGGSIVPPYKEKDLLKKSIKEKEDMFDLFYKAYPRKVSKNPARTAWKKLIKDATFDPDLVIRNAENFAQTCELLKTETRYILHPSTFLNQKRYEDYPVVDPEGLARQKETKFDGNLNFLSQQLGGMPNDQTRSSFALGKGNCGLSEEEPGFQP